jgi:hypothetical protein
MGSAVTGAEAAIACSIVCGISSIAVVTRVILICRANRQAGLRFLMPLAAELALQKKATKEG